MDRRCLARPRGTYCYRAAGWSTDGARSVYVNIKPQFELINNQDLKKFIYFLVFSFSARMGKLDSNDYFLQTFS